MRAALLLPLAVVASKVRATAVPNKYIIELKQGLSVGSISISRDIVPGPVGNDSGSFYTPFDCSDVFNGLVLHSKTENLDTLSAIDGVANVWPLQKLYLLSPVAEKIKEGPGLKTQNYSVHQWTGVDELHAQGIRGKGATVAIIDTGVDYNHKALGGCFGPNCKIAGGYDLVGGNWSSHNEKLHPKLPDRDPIDLHGHGTHVAGILAADNEWLTGVAPDVKILSYKVFADKPVDTEEDTLIQAFCDAYSAGADIITASIGRPNGFADNPWALVASRLVDKGVVVTVSAGNDGNVGAFFAGSGSSGHGVLAVAAVNVTRNLSTMVSDPSAQPLPAPFTSWGPTNELLIKPDIGAPGYQIFSLAPGNTFAYMSGTSMAAPYIAGVAALYISRYGGRELHGSGFARMLSNRIASSGRSLMWYSGHVQPDFIAPPFQVGTGLVNALKVLKYDTRLDFEPFALLDSELFKPEWHADISNLGNDTVTYLFDVEPQAAVELLDSRWGIKSLYSLVPQRVSPNVTLPKEPLTVGPGETKRAEFRFEYPAGVDDDFLPLYGGKVWIRGSNGEELSIPYGGLAYDTEKEFDTMFLDEPTMSSGENGTWTFNVERNRFDYIEMSTTLTYPCFHLRWDIFEPYWSEISWHYPPTVGKNGYVGSVAVMKDSDNFWYYDGQRMDKDDTMSFPMTRLARGYSKYWWFGKLANGTQIAPGEYKFRFAALRPYGNPTISDHWDIMKPIDPLIRILPYNSTRSTNSTGF